MSMIDQKETIECHFNESDKNIYSNGFDIADPAIVKAVTYFHESLSRISGNSAIMFCED